MTESRLEWREGQWIVVLKQNETTMEIPLDEWMDLQAVRAAVDFANEPDRSLDLPTHQTPRTQGKP